MNRTSPIQSVAAVLLLFVLCLQAAPAGAQALPLKSAVEAASETPAEETAWQPPDITDLPAGWWDRLEVISPGQFKQRMDAFLAAADEKLRGLQGDDFVQGQSLLARIRAQSDLLMLALKEPPPPALEPIATKDSYTLDELLALRAQWRDVESRQEALQLRIEELERQATLQQQRADSLLKQYEASDANAPARILLGLQHVAVRIEYERIRRELERQQQRAAQLDEQMALLDQQMEFARAHLVSGDTDWNKIEVRAVEARNEATAVSKKISALQQQLLDVLSSAEPKPSLELLRKQQLTREATRQALARVRENLYQARANWYRFHAGALDFDFDIRAAVLQSRRLVEEIGDQVELWTEASRSTLITPLPDAPINARKNVELAHSVAQETLDLISEIQGASDDLLLVQDILTDDMVHAQRGIRNLVTRLTLLTGSLWESFRSLLDYNLFHIGDAPVTPGGIVTMLLILVFGFVLSWFIRHLLGRLNERRQFAQSSVVYSLGRVLHYIIIIAAVFAALGTIGLDFTNFALIAGALSVGIGFGLQSIVNNFVSGLILLFEGTLRVGDFIELDTGLRGQVKEINTRATVITTNDSVDVVVPNSFFVSNQLTNWTLRESIGRLRIRFGVAYGSDKEQVRDAVLEACAEVDFILMHTAGRAPQVRLVEFGESSMIFEVLVWVSKSGVRRPGFTRARFMWSLEEKLKEYGIQIPFPQRDVHLYGAPHPGGIRPGDLVPDGDGTEPP